MKTYALLVIALLGCAPLFAQSMKKQTFSQHGSADFVYANNKSYFIQQSIGQASVINTYQSGNYKIRQGFLQELQAALINSGFDTEIDVTVYPNPFEDMINMSFDETLVDVITISLHNIVGQLIYQQTFDPSEQLSIQINNLPVGAYVLRGQMRSQAFATKLIKK